MNLKRQPFGCRFFYGKKYLHPMQNQKVYTVEEMQKKLEHYCAYQERCHQEVIQKLRQLKMIPSAIDRIIGYLIEHNYLNETRFARALQEVNSASKSGEKNAYFVNLNNAIFLPITLD